MVNWILSHLFGRRHSFFFVLVITFAAGYVREDWGIGFGFVVLGSLLAAVAEIWQERREQ